MNIMSMYPIDREVNRRLTAILNGLDAIIEYRDRNCGAQAELKGHLDPVSHADKVVEAKIGQLILDHFPSDIVVGEEQKADRGAREKSKAVIRKQGMYIWFVDPICGTCAYTTGLPLFVTNIMCMKDGEVVLSIVALATMPDRYLIAWKDGGAWICGRKSLDELERGADLLQRKPEWNIDKAWNRVPVHASDRSNCFNLDTGMGPKKGEPDWAADTIAALVRSNRFKPFMSGSSIALAWAAMGKLALAIAGACEPWDEVAAFIAHEAGAIVRHLDGSAWSPEGSLRGKGLIVAATPEVYEWAMATMPSFADYPSQTGESTEMIHIPDYAEEETSVASY